MEVASDKTDQSPHFIVFADDWGRHPSSCQHLVRCMLGQYEVTWVNTIGMRPPRLDWVTLQRVFEKVSHWTKRSNDKPSQEDEGTMLRPVVLNPKMWPWFKNSFDRSLNRYLLRKQLQSKVQSNTIGITTIPITAGLMESLPIKKWVYYCVDDFSVWPGLDQATMKSMEEQVIAKADVLIAASENLQERLHHIGRDSCLMTHGVDLDHWRPESAAPPPAILDEFERPFLMFWGVIDRRLDLEFIKHLNSSLDKGTIIFVGPQQNPNEELSELSRVKILPPMFFGELPALGSAADVLIMPYLEEPVTRAMQPLKMLEYLATGKPVVVRDLPATQLWSDMLFAAKTAEEFTQQVENALANGVTDSQTIARQRLVNESWEKKFLEFMKQIFAECQA